MPPAIPMLSPKTKVTLSLGAVVFVLLAGWNARAYFDEFSKHLDANFAALNAAIDGKASQLSVRIDANQAAINQAAGERFTGSDAERWANQLERANREVQRTGQGLGLIVPDPLPRRTRDAEKP